MVRRESKRVYSSSIKRGNCRGRGERELVERERERAVRERVMRRTINFKIVEGYNYKSR